MSVFDIFSGGRNKHCLYPAYAHYYFDTMSYLVSSCEDKSDRIHKNNSLCTIDSYTDKYCNTFCLYLVSFNQHDSSFINMINQSKVTFGTTSEKDSK